MSEMSAQPPHDAWIGVHVDHLYPNCPSLRGEPKKAITQVDPHGTDICGMCLHRYNRTEAK